MNNEIKIFSIKHGVTALKLTGIHPDFISKAVVGKFYLFHNKEYTIFGTRGEVENKAKTLNRGICNPLSANPTKWSNIFKQIVGKS